MLKITKLDNGLRVVTQNMPGLETDGNVGKALEWLRKKGIASAEKKSGRIATEGSIGSYIHTDRKSVV